MKIKTKSKNLSMEKLLYIFIETYSKILLRCILTYHQKMELRKLQNVLHELGNVLWSFFWIFVSQSSVIILNMEYVANVYFEFINECMNKNIKKMSKNIPFESIAKQLCYHSVFKKFNYRIKSLSYNPIQYNTIYIVKNKIDIYLYTNTNTIIKTTDDLSVYLMELHKTYVDRGLTLDLRFELDSLLGSVQAILNSG